MSIKNVWTCTGELFTKIHESCCKRKRYTKYRETWILHILDMMGYSGFNLFGRNTIQIMKWITTSILQYIGTNESALLHNKHTIIGCYCWIMISEKYANKNNLFVIGKWWLPSIPSCGIFTFFISKRKNLLFTKVNVDKINSVNRLWKNIKEE